ncbi:MAG: acyl-CoA dehydrogenase family protein [Planctomycetes bacterium]|nr:acyl-CoA dehydrogenase family protein [Planctomycetota bacterium]
MVEWGRRAGRSPFFREDLMSETASHAETRGVSFLHPIVEREDLFLPESITEDDRLMLDTAREFMEREVLPRAAELEADKLRVSRELLRRAGELGLLGVEVPEEYGGLGLGFRVGMLLLEEIAREGSYACVQGAHTGIGMLPIVFFGTDEQRRRYLPRLVKGELASAFALTEPDAGSDALSIRCKAVLSPDGTHYVVNGEKQWITNAGFADIFVLSAKVDGEHFTTFILERDTPGVTLGREEDKMGIRGSSTRSLILQDVRIPVANRIGEVGRGHKVALNNLNIGRMKLGFGVLGGCRALLNAALGFAAGRKQFGRPIAEFGMIRKKFAEMAIQTFAAESMCYVAAGLIDERVHAVRARPDHTSAEVLGAIEEFAVETASIKVFASEALDYVVDEALQVHGGYGYMKECPVEKAYRDARIHRVFEGTNEINRLVVAGTLLRRVLTGRLDLGPRATEAEASLETGVLDHAAPAGTGIGPELERLERLKRAGVYVLMKVGQVFADRLREEQEVLEGLADVVMDLEACDAALRRVLWVEGTPGDRGVDLYQDLGRGVLATFGPRVERNLVELLSYTWPAMEPASADRLARHLFRVRSFLEAPPVNRYALRRRIAERLSARGRYLEH